jgi:transposase
MRQSTTIIHPPWATKFRKPGTELRLIKNRYYLYAYKTVYNPATKKPKKVSGACLGSITKEFGFKESAKRLVEKNANWKVGQSIVVKEYGVSILIYKRLKLYVQRLEKFFPHSWQQIVAIAYCRFVYRCPLKSIVYRLESSFLYELTGMATFNDKTASGVLNNIGGQKEQLYAYMKSFIGKDDYILMDGTSLVSKSANIGLARKGYNTQNNFDGQVNLLYVYSATTRMPVFYRLLPGNIRDVKAFKNTLALTGIKQAIIVTDKGFYSKANITLLRSEKLSYIIPLKRDNHQIDYTALVNNTFKIKGQYFTHEKRIVWYLQRSTEDGETIHLFLDDSLKLKEESDYLTRIKNNPETNSIEAYQSRMHQFGTIALLTEKKLFNSEEVYETYKSRMFIETMFDGMKNILEADHTYMQNEQTMEGWMFVNHLCLQWYQELYIELKEKQLIKKISVNDYIQLLTDVKKIKINNQWHLNEFTNATHKLISKIGINLYNT